jgi:hypothetical protein
MEVGGGSVEGRGEIQVEEQDGGGKRVAREGRRKAWHTKKAGREGSYLVALRSGMLLERCGVLAHL